MQKIAKDRNKNNKICQIKMSIAFVFFLKLFKADISISKTLALPLAKKALNKPQISTTIFGTFYNF